MKTCLQSLIRSSKSPFHTRLHMQWSYMNVYIAGKICIWISLTLIFLFNNFSPGDEQSEQRILAHKKKNPSNCLYSNASQILLLYKTWGYYNKFDSVKSLTGGGWVGGGCFW